MALAPSNSPYKEIVEAFDRAVAKANEQVHLALKGEQERAQALKTEAGQSAKLYADLKAAVMPVATALYQHLKVCPWCRNRGGLQMQAADERGESLGAPMYLNSRLIYDLAGFLHIRYAEESDGGTGRPERRRSSPDDRRDWSVREGGSRRVDWTGAPSYGRRAGDDPDHDEIP